MRIIDAIARTILVLIVGIIIGASWVLHELSPQIEKLTHEVFTQDNEIRLLKAKVELQKIRGKR